MQYECKITVLETKVFPELQEKYLADPNRDGLFSINPVKGIDDRESGYDDSQERRELEKVADMLFG